MGSSYVNYLPNDAPFYFQDRIWKAGLNETQFSLVNDISRRYAELNTEYSSLKRRLQDLEASSEPPAGKKRKLENPSSTNNANNVPTTAPAAASDAVVLGNPVFQADSVSFVAPQRKKFKFGLVPEMMSSAGGITTDGNALIRWRDIEQVISVSVPEKATPAHYIIIIPSAAATQVGSASEPIVFTVPDTAPQEVTFAPGHETHAGLPFHELFEKLMNTELRKVGKKIASPDAREFQSALVQAHRKGEKAYHVKAFRGSKDGFLYFLSTGILFGFKKPILYYPLSSITSTSYSSILQRTFNLNITAQLTATDSTFCIPGAPTASSESPKDVEFEFSMLDQADFSGIDAYVKGHGLNDASLAEARRAKKVNVSKAKEVNGTESNGQSADGAVEEEEESELTRAERELQDREDEEEEDYEESGGDSDGSGSESESEEEEGGEVYDEGEEEAQEDEDQMNYE